MIKILELFDYVEFNEKAVRSYNAMFDNRYQPQTVVGYDLKPDILVHGSPCQDFSIAGKQYGGNVEDGTRSSLMFETIRIIENLGVWKPRVVIWENVTNVLSKRMKGAFNHYLDDMTRLGYTNSYDVLDARDFGIPQARKRLFTVSTLDKHHFNFFNLEQKPTRPISEFLETTDEVQYIVKAPSMLKYIPGSETFVDPSQTKFKGRLTIIEDYCMTVTTAQDRNPNSGVIDLKDGRYRVLTERECWRLMGFDDEDFNNALKAHPGTNGKLNGILYHQAGNSMVVDVLEAIFKEVIK